MTSNPSATADGEARHGSALVHSGRIESRAPFYYGADTPVLVTELTASSLNEGTRLALDRFSAEQLVEACRRMEIYSSRAIDLKMAIAHLLADVAVADLTKKWESQSVVPDPEGYRVAAGRAMIDSLGFALSATRARYRFRDTVMRMKQLADQLALLSVQLPEGELRTHRVGKAVLAHILSASVPEKMSPTACPLLARGHNNPWRTSAELDRERAHMIEDGALIFVCNGSTALATLLYYDARLMYFRDIYGPMESALMCDSAQLSRLLPEK